MLEANHDILLRNTLTFLIEIEFRTECCYHHISNNGDLCLRYIIMNIHGLLKNVPNNHVETLENRMLVVSKPCCSGMIGVNSYADVKESVLYAIPRGPPRFSTAKTSRFPLILYHEVTIIKPILAANIFENTI